MRQAIGALLFSLLMVSGGRAGEPGPETFNELPEHRVANWNAPAVTESNLLQSEAFWPYQVALREGWKPQARTEPLPADSTGVLIRVEPQARARIDFGRDGLFGVPVGATDLVERANRIRMGELTKVAPNFVFAIAPRLLEISGDTIRGYRMPDASAYHGFITVFADPATGGFQRMARGLAPLLGRREALTIFLPQGRHPDTAVADQLRSLDWPVPFLYDHLAEAYTDTLLPAALAIPSVMLQTSEGRVLFQAPWSDEAPAKLAAALDRFLGDAESAAVVTQVPSPRPPSATEASPSS